MSAGVCRAAAIAMAGLDGTLVQVEAGVSNQLPGFAIIGLPDTALAEAKQRVRVATQQAGFSLTDRFLTVNLSPAALPKQGSGFDLAIALSALAASAQLPAHRLGDVVHVGELSLDGDLRRPPGLLSAVLAAQRLGCQQVMVPAACAREASLVTGIEVIAADSLRGAVQWHRGEAGSWRVVTAETETTDRQNGLAGSTGTIGADDISDVVGQAAAIEALVVAAAGRHHLSMVGPPGAGKTLLASRLTSILPDLNDDESITVSSIASLGGASLTELVRRPPFESPHHSASKVAIIGGGDARGVHPGSITRACHGVLFLDEAPEFSRDVLDGLRQPLESGVIEIHRAKVHAVLPARMQVVIAANPCPCGNADSINSAQPCVCTPHQRRRYLARLSGPLMDRIDLRLHVRRVPNILLAHDEQPRPTSMQLRQRVVAARARASERLKDTPWRTNGELKGSWLRAPATRLSRSATAVLDAAYSRGAISMRGYDRVLRLAWTVADLADKERPERSDVAYALALRSGAAAAVL